MNTARLSNVRKKAGYGVPGGIYIYFTGCSLRRGVGPSVREMYVHEAINFVLLRSSSLEGSSVLREEFCSAN